VLNQVARHKDVFSAQLNDRLNVPGRFVTQDWSPLWSLKAT